MTKKDLKGREYANIKKLKPGDKIQIDGDFTCAKPWSVHEVKEKDGDLYFECDEKFHGLDGQISDARGTLIGVYKL